MSVSSHAYDDESVVPGGIPAKKARVKPACLICGWDLNSNLNNHIWDKHFKGHQWTLPVAALPLDFPDILWRRIRSKSDYEVYLSTAKRKSNPCPFFYDPRVPNTIIAAPRADEHMFIGHDTLALKNEQPTTTASSSVATAAQIQQLQQSQQQQQQQLVLSGTLPYTANNGVVYASAQGVSVSANADEPQYLHVEAPPPRSFTLSSQPNGQQGGQLATTTSSATGDGSLFPGLEYESSATSELFGLTSSVLANYPSVSPTGSMSPLSGVPSPSTPVYSSGSSSPYNDDNSRDGTLLTGGHANGQSSSTTVVPTTSITPSPGHSGNSSPLLRNFSPTTSMQPVSVLGEGGDTTAQGNALYSQLQRQGETGPEHMLVIRHLDVAGHAFKRSPGDSFTRVSDRRLKNIKNKFELGMDVVNKLQLYLYEYNGLGGTVKDGQVHVGVMAQDLLEIEELSGLGVLNSYWAPMHEGDTSLTQFYTVNMSAVLPYVLVNGLQSLSAEVADMAARNAELAAAQARMVELTERLSEQIHSRPRHHTSSRDSPDAEGVNTTDSVSSGGSSSSGSNSSSPSNNNNNNNNNNNYSNNTCKEVEECQAQLAAVAVELAALKTALSNAVRDGVMPPSYSDSPPTPRSPASGVRDTDASSPKAATNYGTASGVGLGVTVNGVDGGEACLPAREENTDECLCGVRVIVVLRVVMQIFHFTAATVALIGIILLLVSFFTTPMPEPLALYGGVCLVVGPLPIFVVGCYFMTRASVYDRRSLYVDGNEGAHLLFDDDDDDVHLPYTCACLQFMSRHPRQNKIVYALLWMGLVFATVAYVAVALYGLTPIVIMMMTSSTPKFDYKGVPECPDNVYCLTAAPGDVGVDKYKHFSMTLNATVEDVNTALYGAFSDLVMYVNGGKACGNTYMVLLRNQYFQNRFRLFWHAECKGSHVTTTLRVMSALPSDVDPVGREYNKAILERAIQVLIDMEDNPSRECKPNKVSHACTKLKAQPVL